MNTEHFLQLHTIKPFCVCAYSLNGSLEKEALQRWTPLKNQTCRMKHTFVSITFTTDAGALHCGWQPLNMRSKKIKQDLDGLCSGFTKSHLHNKLIKGSVEMRWFCDVICAGSVMFGPKQGHHPTGRSLESSRVLIWTRCSWSPKTSFFTISLGLRFLLVQAVPHKPHNTFTHACMSGTTCKWNQSDNLCSEWTLDQHEGSIKHQIHNE